MTAVLILAAVLGAVAVTGILLSLYAGVLGLRTWLRRLTGQERARP